MHTQTITELEQAVVHARGKKRTALLHKLAELNLSLCPEKAFALLSEAHEYSHTRNDRSATAHGLLLLARWHSASGNTAHAWDLLSQAEALARTLNNNILSAELLMTASVFYYNRDQIQEALAAIEQAHAISDPDHIHHVQSLASMGFLYYSAGWYDKAYEVITRTLSLLEKDRDSSQNTLLLAEKTIQVQVACFRCLADLHIALGDTASASGYARRGIALCRDAGYLTEMINLCCTLGELESTHGSYDESIRYYSEALAAAQQLHNMPFISNAYIRLAAVYLKLGQNNTASQYLAEAFAHITDLNSALLSAEAWFCRAGIVAATGAPEQAIAALHTALHHAQDNLPDLRSRIYASLAALYEQQENTREAYVWYKRHIHQEEELHGRSVQETINRIRMQHMLRTGETEKEMLRLRALQLEQQADHRQQIISRMALNLVRKHEGLEKLRADILARMENTHEDNRQMFRRMIRNIDSQLNSEEDWMYFEQQFADVHAEFTALLSQRFPLLTPTELRICMLLRLNLSTKDIAGLLCSSVHTVHTHRRRIRKKLGLEKDAGLVALLMSVQTGHG